MDLNAVTRRCLTMAMRILEGLPQECQPKRNMAEIRALFAVLCGRRKTDVVKSGDNARVVLVLTEVCSTLQWTAARVRWGRLIARACSGEQPSPLQDH